MISFVVALLLAIVAVGASAASFQQRASLFSLAVLSKKDHSLSGVIVYAGGVTAFLCVWLALSAIAGDGPTRLPSPWSVGMQFIRSTVDGTIPNALWRSAIRICIGFAIAAVVGSSLGILAGGFVFMERMVMPTNSFLRYIPPTAFVTLLIVYCGIDESYKIAVVFTSVVFFILQMSFDSIRNVDRAYAEMGATMGMSRTAILMRILLPAAAPSLLDVWRINLGGAWTFLVAAEVVGAKGGLGHLISNSQRFGRIELLFAAVLTFGVVGVCFDFWLLRLRSRLFPWSRLAVQR